MDITTYKTNAECGRPSGGSNPRGGVACPRAAGKAEEDAVLHLGEAQSPYFGAAELGIRDAEAARRSAVAGVEIGSCRAVEAAGFHHSHNLGVAEEEALRPQCVSRS